MPIAYRLTPIGTRRFPEMSKLKTGVSLLSFGLVLFLAVGTVSWGANEEDIHKKIEQTKKKLSQTKMKENKVLGSLLRTQQELETINTNLERLNFNLDKTVQRMDNIKLQLDNAQEELERIKIEIGGRKGVLDERLIAIYKYGYQSSLEVLFRAKNYSEFISRFEMVSYYVRADIHILKTLQQQQSIITQKRAEIADKQSELLDQKITFSKLQAQNEAEQNRKISMMQDKKVELSALQNDRKVLEASLDEMERTSKEMEAQIKNLQNKNHPALGSGKLIWPVSGEITSYFGWRFHPILHKKKFHSGLDIAAVMGTPIEAADAGVVIFCGRNGGYGNMIALDHGNEISTVYGHCSVILVTNGQTVAKGETIGKVGSTGFSTGPHLHFEVRKEGVPVDPLSSLKAL
jgi:murein DD-endopeptidase MepM/ murein hydrolase activator NlpD